MERTLISDEDLAALALAADTDAPLGDDAISFSEHVGEGRAELLPSWYMPAPTGTLGPIRGWRRRVVWLVIAAFLTITAYGLCNTYGDIFAS